jgi:3-hydroxybutyryl-CoA dehydrogenase
MLNMRIAVKAHPHQKDEWLLRHSNNGIELLWTDNNIPSADAYFDLTFEEYGAAFDKISDKPVFINAVVDTLNELPSNVSRINGWKGCLQKEISEVVFRNDDAKNILDSLGWKYREVPDVPGMIAARTISMIINEAYFALGDEVSSKEEIDTAMKLGTNYPYGPFEWSRIIGLHNIYRLLKKLSSTDNRYRPAPALEQELKAIA